MSKVNVFIKCPKCKENQQEFIEWSQRGDLLETWCDECEKEIVFRPIFHTDVEYYTIKEIKGKNNG